MKCPHCGIGISEEWDKWHYICHPVPARNHKYDEAYNIITVFCPDCKKIIIKLQHGYGYEKDRFNNETIVEVEKEEILYPKVPIEKHFFNSIPKRYAEIYSEASQISTISPRASATLSRYLLQNILHEELNIKKKTLAEEISALESNKDIPSNLVEILQVFRRVANFGAHPKKSTHSHEIIDVEKNEADVMLIILEELFDYVFIKPKKRDEFKKSVAEKFGIEP